MGYTLQEPGFGMLLGKAGSGWFDPGRVESSRFGVVGYRMIWFGVIVGRG